MRKLDQCETTGEREAKEAELGCRYTVLLQLPYFDPVRMAVIDPMHNLFLGTARRMMKIWKEAKLVSDKELEEMQTMINKFEVPSNVGRIPHKIGSKFGGLTADQLRAWTTVFSVYLLNDILPKEDLECWRHFVLAAQLLCSKSLKITDVKIIDKYLLQFCQGVEKLYTKKVITPNMHLHCHLAECVYDFGPIYSFWCFSFERYNGLLGSYTSNKKDVEIQIMNHFVSHSELEDMSMNETDVFSDLFQQLNKVHSDRGSLVTAGAHGDLFRYSRMAGINFPLASDWSDIGCFSFDCPSKGLLSNTDLYNLTQMYNSLYPLKNYVVLQSVKFVKHVRMFGNVYGTPSSRSHRSAFICAFWSDTDGNINDNYLPSELRPAQIKRILIHNILFNDDTVKQHIILHLGWFLPCSNDIKITFGKPIEVWNINFEDPSPSSFMPVQRVQSKFVFVKEEIDGRQSMVVAPLAHWN